MEIAPVLTELGTTVAVLAIFGWLIWKLLVPFIDRLMDNLDRQAQSYVSNAEAQVKTAVTLDKLCQQLDGVEEEHQDRVVLQDARQKELREAQKEIVGALRGLQQQFQAHESRAHDRHEQQIKLGEQQLELGKQQLEQGAQILAGFKSLNGKG